MSIASTITLGLIAPAQVTGGGDVISPPVPTVTGFDFLGQAAVDLAHMVDGSGAGFDLLASYGENGVRGFWRDEWYDGDRDGATFLIREVDLDTITHGTTLTIESVTYAVQGVRRDGAGLVELLLEQRPL